MQGDGGLDNALVMILVIFAGALFGGGSMGRIHGNNKHRLVAMVVFLAVDFRSIFFICWCLLLRETVVAAEHHQRSFFSALQP